MLKFLDLKRDLGVLEDAEFVAGDAFEELWIFEHFYEAVDGCVAWFFGDRHRQIDERAHILVDAFEQGAAAGEDHAAIVDVSGDLGAEFG